jgi:SAM-dependent methyltransferase
MEHMALYDSLAKVYDKLFPVNPATISAIEALISSGADKRVLDLGAATGGHTAEFARRGWDAVGIELNPSMVQIAREHAHVLPGSMTNAARLVEDDYGTAVRFAAVLCLGNTLPHLPPYEIGSFFSMVKGLLGRDAPFIVQMLNYSHPAIGPGYRFPDIVSDSFSFSRKYEAGPEQGTLRFVTRFADESGESSDMTVLHGHTHRMVREKLAEAGFREFTLWSGWDGRIFDPLRDVYLVLAAR